MNYVKLFEDWDPEEDWEEPNLEDTRASGIVPEWLQYIYDYMEEDHSKYQHKVRPQFDLSKWKDEVTHLPTGLIIYGPLSLDGCINLTHLPDDLQIYNARTTFASGRINFKDCHKLTNYPAGLSYVGGSLNLINCRSLTELPDGLTVKEYADIIGCTGLTKLPNNFTVGGSLDLENCINLEEFPNGLNVGSGKTLYVNGCKKLIGNLTAIEISKIIVEKGGNPISHISTITL